MVEIYEDGRVEPSVGVMSTSPGAFMMGREGIPQQPNLETVRRGTSITNKVIEFAEAIKREAWEVAS